MPCALFTGFLQRGFFLYTSQIERSRTSFEHQKLTHKAFTFKGALHALYRGVKAEGVLSLVHGSSTLALLAGINSMGAMSMWHFYSKVGRSNSVEEDVKNAFFGLGCAVGTEYIIAPLRSLYLLQATTPIGTPYFMKTRDLAWLRPAL